MATIPQITLKSVVDELAAAAEKRGYRGSIVLNPGQLSSLLNLAREENAIHPASVDVLVVDGYAYMQPAKMKSGLFQLRYERRDTAAECLAKIAVMAKEAEIRKERDAAIQHYSRTGETTLLEAFLKNHPEEAEAAKGG